MKRRYCRREILCFAQCEVKRAAHARRHFTMRSITSLRQQLLVPQGTLRSPEKKKADAFASAFLFWRSRRDLNPRYPFGVHTISSRARYDHFDTAPYLVGVAIDLHIVTQVLSFVKHFFHFSQIFFPCCLFRWDAL